MRVLRVFMGLGDTDCGPMGFTRRFGQVPGTPQVLFAQNLRRRTPCHEFARQQERFGILLTNVFEIVQDADYRATFAIPAPHQRRQVANRIGVDSAIGLVKQYQRRILQYHPGKARPLQLAAGELADRPVFQSTQAHRRDRIFNALFGRSIEATEGTELGPQSQGDKIVNDDGETGIEGRLLGEVGDVFALQADQLDSPLHWPEFTDDAFEQRRFPGAIGSDKGQQAPGGYFALEMMHGRMPLVAKRQVIEADNSRCRRVHDSAQWIVTHSNSRAPEAQIRRETAPAHSAGLGRAGGGGELFFNPAGIGAGPIFLMGQIMQQSCIKGKCSALPACYIFPLAWSIAFLVASRQYERIVIVD